MTVHVTFDCADIPKGNFDHVLQLPEHSTVADALRELVAVDAVGGLSYEALEQEHEFLRNYLMITPETELFDGDRFFVILTMDGG